MKTPYKLSKDYEALYELVLSRNIIPAFVDYRFKNTDDVFRDICQIKKTDILIDFGCRGRSYMSIDDMEVRESTKIEKELFIDACKYLNVEYIDHNLHLHYETVNSLLSEKVKKWMDKVMPLDKDPVEISMSPEARNELMADLEEINNATVTIKPA